MYKYTNGEILDEEYFMSQFSKVTEKINPENYKDEVEDGLYKDTEIAVTKETQQLKFRYKDPDGQLIEQENVPVVIDGTSVKSIRYFTALSTTTEKPSEDKFTETVKDVDSVNRFLWQFVVTELTDGTSQGSYADAQITGAYGNDGKKGERGAEYLGCFATNADAYNSREGNLVTDDFYLNSTDGYIHVVVSSELIEGKIKAEWVSITDYTDTRYKQAMNDMIAIAGSDRSEGFMSVVNLWVKNLTAQTALIQELFAKNVTVESQLTVNKLKATNANIEGEIFANTGYLKNLDIKGELSFPLSEKVIDFYNPTTDETNVYEAGLNANGTFYIPKIITNRLDVNESGIFSSKMREIHDCSSISFGHVYWDELPEKYLILVDGGDGYTCMIEVFYQGEDWWYKINDMNFTIFTDDYDSNNSFPNHAKNLVKKVCRMDSRSARYIYIELKGKFSVRIYGYLKTPYAN